MTTGKTTIDEAERKGGGRRGLRLGSLAGVEIRLDWSLLIIFMLVLGSLGLGVLPRWHPGWPAAISWSVALAAALLFFASVLVHELAHAMTAQALGVRIRRITLFLLGGLAQMDDEAKTPTAELLIALAGPLASVLIGATAIAGGLMAAAPILVAASYKPAVVLALAGPMATLLLWLGPINLLLALFNLIPGFPLDGGRVLRAVIWWVTGSLDQATRWASFAGQVTAWGLMALGVAMAFGLWVPFFGTGLVGGLWLLLVGWFLASAATTSYGQYVLLHALENVSVRDVMRGRFDSVTPEMPVDVFVRDHFLAGEEQAFPVTPGGGDDHIVGLVTPEDVRKVEPSEWGATTVGAIMTPAEQLHSLDPAARARDALSLLAEGELRQIPVVEDGHLRGLVRRADILRWLSLRPRPAAA